jgi:SAM-dependent methyltransferase
MVDPDVRAVQLAADSLSAGSPTAWFDRLYAEAGRGEADVPWDRGAPHPLLVEWLDSRSADVAGLRAMVVGAGPGHDAELLSTRGFSTTGFDVSPTAVVQARDRYPESTVDYRVADLFALAQEWTRAFDLVVEIMTVQSMPRDVRRRAVASVRDLVAPGGTLFVCGAVAPTEPSAGPPWPLDRTEMESFADERLELVALDELPGVGGARRWRGEYTALS